MIENPDVVDVYTNFKKNETPRKTQKINLLKTRSIKI